MVLARLALSLRVHSTQAGETLIFQRLAGGYVGLPPDFQTLPKYKCGDGKLYGNLHCTFEPT